ncbi:hypothetical protein [Streptomyces sp. 8N706]|uniref:hypothetical protein n=1 Tax=Streptomyces sp. 8N706 TaxID=3457416 RepID=UPI003FD3D14B
MSSRRADRLVDRSALRCRRRPGRPDPPGWPASYAAGTLYGPYGRYGPYGELFRLVLGCEPVAAVRALCRRDPPARPGPPVGRAYRTAAEVLAPDLRDRPLTDDVTAAAGVLDRFSEL